MPLTSFAKVEGEQVTYPAKANSRSEASSLDLPLFSQLE